VRIEEWWVIHETRLSMTLMSSTCEKLSCPSTYTACASRYEYKRGCVQTQYRQSASFLPCSDIPKTSHDTKTFAHSFVQLID
jgi:hypothetical protein